MAFFTRGFHDAFDCVVPSALHGPRHVPGSQCTCRLLCQGPVMVLIESVDVTYNLRGADYRPSFTGPTHFENLIDQIFLFLKNLIDQISKMNKTDRSYFSRGP